VRVLGLEGFWGYRRACCSLVRLEAMRFTPGLIKHSFFVRGVRVMIPNLREGGSYVIWNAGDQDCVGYFRSRSVSIEMP
jgi:hypothetical protein